MHRPVHQIRIGRIRAVIWANSGENGTWHNVTFERSYREDDQWKSSDNFGRDDLLILAKLADQAHSWIVARQAEARDRDPATSTAGTA